MMLWSPSHEARLLGPGPAGKAGGSGLNRLPRGVGAARVAQPRGCPLRPRVLRPADRPLFLLPRGEACPASQSRMAVFPCGPFGAGLGRACAALRPQPPGSPTFPSLFQLSGCPPGLTRRRIVGGLPAATLRSRGLRRGWGTATAEAGRGVGPARPPGARWVSGHMERVSNMAAAAGGGQRCTGAAL